MTPGDAYKKRGDCRYCHSKNLKKFLSLGDQPPSNSFISPSQIEKEKKYPLDVYVCLNCFLSQLLDVVSATIIFDDYLYLSSSSKALQLHYGELARLLTNKYRLGRGDVVVDIGCNDGILLHGYNEKITRIGVEPSKVAKIARETGLTVVNKFFDRKSAEEIVSKYGSARVITATNVFAHVDDIDEFTAGIPTLLSDKGVFIIEAPYLLDMIDGGSFDTIYHEHLCYLSLTPMIPFLSKFDLEVFDVQRIPFGASGPAFRIYVAKKNAHPTQVSVPTMLRTEIRWGIKSVKRYQEYKTKVRMIKKETLTIIKKLQKKGFHIGGYGAPAKGNTLLNYFGITSKQIDCIAETNPLKQGMVTPGTHIPIVAEEEFLSLMPEYALLLSWNYLNFFLEKSEYVQKGGKFIVPIPRPKIAS